MANDPCAGPEAEAEETSGVVVGDVPELGGAAAVAKRSFGAGRLVFRERALVVAAAPTNLARVRAYCDLPAAKQRTLRKQYWGEAPAVRCRATAAMREDSAGTGDSAAEVLTALRAEGRSELELAEVEEVIRVFNLNAYDCALAPLACKVSHSCTPNVFVRVDADSCTVEAWACRAIAEGESLGTWYFQDTGLWWMGADIRRAMFETDRGFLCGCRRCTAPDTCRALPCDACGKEGSSAVPDGAAAGSDQRAWRCGACGRSSTGDAVRLKAEAEIVPRVLLELRPPRGVGAEKATPEELGMLEADARSRLGPAHWATAAASLVLHFRARPPGGGNCLDRLSVACGCRFVGWLVGRGLANPPSSVIRTPVSVAVECASWLAPLGPASRAGVGGEICDRLAAADRRCLAARLLSEFLLPVFDASGSLIAHVAKTGEKVEALRTWHAALRGACGRCGCALAPEGAANAAGGGGPPGRPPALACGRCKQVRYCGRECQTADWKERHKAGCLAASEPLGGDAAFQLLLAAP